LATILAFFKKNIKITIIGAIFCEKTVVYHWKLYVMIIIFGDFRHFWSQTQAFFIKTKGMISFFGDFRRKKRFSPSTSFPLLKRI
jgi:hypothetical protein